MNLKPLAALCLAVLPAFAAPSDEAEIRAVAAAFHDAIAARDEVRFMALFHGPSIPWLAVFDDAAFKRVQKHQPGAPKADALGGPGPADFIKEVVAAPKAFEERFSNLRIDTDGLVAAATFDYTFHIGGEQVNRGHETWHLVHTERGWRISSVIYSVHVD